MFTAKTTHSGTIKAMFELLFQNMTRVCLTIDENGIKSDSITNQNILIRFELPSKLFDNYEFTFDEPLHIGLGSQNNQFFKSVKNKSSITFSITKAFVLDIIIDSNVDHYRTSISATLETVQNISHPTIESYDTLPITITSSTFNQICKSFKSPSLNITKKDGQLHFSFEVEGISTKTLTFGKLIPEDVSLFHKSFRSDQFIRIGKLSSFANEPIRIYAENGKPLYIEAQSNLGCMRLSIPSDDDTDL